MDRATIVGSFTQAALSPDPDLAVAAPYLELIPSGEQDDEEREDRERIWEHVKTLRKRVASLN